MSPAATAGTSTVASATGEWADLVEFEIVPVATSKDMWRR
ncbi:DUF3303 family protein [Mesorhizobium sp. B2-4-12]